MQAKSDIRALLDAVPVKPHVALSVLAELFIGKWYAGDRSRRSGKIQAEVWPGHDVREMADDVYEALEFHAGDLSDLHMPMGLILKKENPVDVDDTSWRNSKASSTGCAASI